MNLDTQFVKIIVVGDPGVGKTSFINKYCSLDSEESLVQKNQYFLLQYQHPTVGCEFYTKNVQSHGIQLKLQLWDVAGQDKYKALTNLFVKKSQGCIIMADVTNNQSLQNCSDWKNIIQDHSDCENMPIFLVQNKIDLIEGYNIINRQDISLDDNKSRVQIESDLKDFAVINEFDDYFQVSVQKNEKIDIVFETLLTQMINRKLIKPSKSQRYLGLLFVYISLNSSFALSANQKPSNKTEKGTCYC